MTEREEVEAMREERDRALLLVGALHRALTRFAPRWYGHQPLHNIVTRTLDHD